MFKSVAAVCAVGTAHAAITLNSAPIKHDVQFLPDSPDLGVQVPDYPLSYTLTGTMTIPYANVKEPVTVVTDADNNRQFVSFYHGLKELIYVNLGTEKARSYEFFIADNERVCFQGNVTGDAQKLDADGEHPLKWPVRFLPNLKDYQYRGQLPCKPNLGVWRARINRARAYLFLCRPMLWCYESAPDPIGMPCL
jgi:hypothetical protein